MVVRSERDGRVPFSPRETFPQYLEATTYPPKRTTRREQR